IFGFSSALTYLPDDALTVAVLYNADGARPGMLGTGRLAQLLAAQAIGQPYPDKTPIAIDETTLRHYEGVYRIDAASARGLRVADARLTSQRTDGPTYGLLSVGRDSFAFEEGFSRVEFERDADGRVAAMRYFPEDEGDGEVVARSDEPLPPGREAIALPREALERITGTYTGSGMTLTVLLDGDTPRAQLAGQPAFEIFAESESKFFLKVVEATLEFAAGADPAAQVTLRQGGQELVFKRIR